jgi:hypothetical protein
MAGKHYAPKADTEEKLIQAAVEALGLSQFETFDVSKKVIEAQLG